MESKPLRNTLFTPTDLYDIQGDKHGHIEIISDNEMKVYRPENIVTLFNLTPEIVHFRSTNPVGNIYIGLETEREIVLEPMSRVTLNDFVGYFTELLYLNQLSKVKMLRSFVIKTQQHGVLHQLINNFTKCVSMMWRQTLAYPRDDYLYVAVRINPISGVRKTFKVSIPTGMRRELGDNFFARAEMIIQTTDRAWGVDLEPEGKRQMGLYWYTVNPNTFAREGNNQGKIRINFKATDLKHLGFDPSFFSSEPSHVNNYLPIEDSVAFECFITFNRGTVALRNGMFAFERNPGFQWSREIEQNVTELYRFKGALVHDNEN